MLYEEFKRELLEKAKEKFNSCDVEYVTYKKINQTVERLGIYEQMDNRRICTLIDPKDLYRIFQTQKEDPWNAVMGEIEEAMKNKDIKLEVPNVDFVKNNVVIQLISYEENKELLSTCPYKSWLDLAYVMKVMWNYGAGMASILVTHKLIEHLKLDPKELFCTAERNMLSKYGLPRCVKMGSYLKKNNILFFEENIELDDGLYILTNDSETLGACLMGNAKIMQTIYRKLGSSFYILPSSIHEVLLLGKTDADRTDELKDIVKEVNEQCVKPEIFLSNSVYEFDGEKVKIVE